MSSEITCSARHVVGGTGEGDGVAAHVHLGGQAGFECAKVPVSGTQKPHHEVGRNSHAAAKVRGGGRLAGCHVGFDACFLGFPGRGFDGKDPSAGSFGVKPAMGKYGSSVYHAVIVMQEISSHMSPGSPTV